jgi:hypothetical protein
LNTAKVQLAGGEVFDSLSVLAVDERRDLAIVKVRYTVPLGAVINASTFAGDPEIFKLTHLAQWFVFA